MGDMPTYYKVNNLFLVLLNHKILKGSKQLYSLSASVLLLTSMPLTLPLIPLNADIRMRLPTSQK